MSQNDKPRSVARAFRLQIASSPFNSVKLELALVLLLAVATLFLLAGLDTPRSLDALILAVVAGVGAAWIVARSRKVLRRAQAEAADGQK